MKFQALTADALVLYATTLVQKAEHAPWYSKVGALIAGAFTFAARDLLFGALILATLASVIDWYYGRAVARKNGTFQKELGTYGWQVKSGAIMVVLLVRVFEAWLYTLPDRFSIDTAGAVSAALAVGIFIDELDSIDGNIQALGGKGIPGLSHALGWLRAVSGRWASAGGKAVPKPDGER